MWNAQDGGCSFLVRTGSAKSPVVQRPHGEGSDEARWEALEGVHTVGHSLQARDGVASIVVVADGAEQGALLASDGPVKRRGRGVGWGVSQVPSATISQQ